MAAKKKGTRIRVEKGMVRVPFGEEATFTVPHAPDERVVHVEGRESRVFERLERKTRDWFWTAYIAEAE
jgi:carbohydrate-binding DOMON domain-containing protein